MSEIGSINYNNIKNSPAYSGGATIYSNASNLTGTKYNNTLSSYAPSLNVMDIDWCGAEINGTSLNTTSDFLLMLKSLFNRCDVLDAYQPVVITLSSITWSGGSIASQIVCGASSTLTKGTVTANWSDGSHSDITSQATFSVSAGSISGTRVTAPNNVTTVTISVSYTVDNVTRTASTKLSYSAIAEVLTGITWSGGSLSATTAAQGSTVRINSKGTIKAQYNSGREEDVTSSATLYTNSDSGAWGAKINNTTEYVRICSSYDNTKQYVYAAYNANGTYHTSSTKITINVTGSGRFSCDHKVLYYDTNKHQLIIGSVNSSVDPSTYEPLFIEVIPTNYFDDGLGRWMYIGNPSYLINEKGSRVTYQYGNSQAFINMNLSGNGDDNNYSSIWENTGNFSERPTYAEIFGGNAFYSNGSIKLPALGSSWNFNNSSYALSDTGGFLHQGSQNNAELCLFSASGGRELWLAAIGEALPIMEDFSAIRSALSTLRSKGFNVPKRFYYKNFLTCTIFNNQFLSCRPQTPDGDGMIKQYSATGAKSVDVASELLITASDNLESMFGYSNSITRTVTGLTWSGVTLSSTSVESGSTISITSLGTAILSYSDRGSEQFSVDLNKMTITISEGSVSGTTITAPTVNSSKVVKLYLNWDGIQSQPISFTTNPKVVSLTGISWNNGSVSNSNVVSGLTTTLNKGTVTAYYDNGTTNDVTSSASFTVNNGASISGTTITAPTVTSNRQITVSVSYNGYTASNTVSFTVVPASLTRITWNGSITNVGSNYATLNKGTVIAYYNDGSSNDVTSSTTFTGSNCTISGTTISVDSSSKGINFTVTANYGGKTVSKQATTTGGNLVIGTGFGDTVLYINKSTGKVKISRSSQNSNWVPMLLQVIPKNYFGTYDEDWTYGCSRWMYIGPRNYLVNYGINGANISYYNHSRLLPNYETGYIGRRARRNDGYAFGEITSTWNFKSYRDPNNYLIGDFEQNHSTFGTDVDTTIEMSFNSGVCEANGTLDLPTIPELMIIIGCSTTINNHGGNIGGFDSLYVTRTGCTYNINPKTGIGKQGVYVIRGISDGNGGQIMRSSITYVTNGTATALILTNGDDWSWNGSPDIDDMSLDTEYGNDLSYTPTPTPTPTVTSVFWNSTTGSSTQSSSVPDVGVITVRMSDNSTSTSGATAGGRGYRVYGNSSLTNNVTSTAWYNTPGTYYLTAMYNGTEYKTGNSVKTWTVNAAIIGVTSLSLSSSTTEVTVGSSITLTATVSPTNATNKSINWSGSGLSFSSTTSTSGNSITVSTSTAGTYYVRATSAANSSATQQIALTFKAASSGAEGLGNLGSGFGDNILYVNRSTQKVYITSDILNPSSGYEPLLLQVTPYNYFGSYSNHWVYGASRWIYIGNPNYITDDNNTGYGDYKYDSGAGNNYSELYNGKTNGALKYNGVGNGVLIPNIGSTWVLGINSNAISDCRADGEGSFVSMQAPNDDGTICSGEGLYIGTLGEMAVVMTNWNTILNTINKLRNAGHTVTRYMENGNFITTTRINGENCTIRPKTADGHIKKFGVWDDDNHYAYFGYESNENRQHTYVIPMCDGDDFSPLNGMDEIDSALFGIN